MKRSIHPGIVVTILALAAGGARATDRISLGVNSANAGAKGVPITASITNDLAIHGYSLAVTYDPGNLSLAQVTLQGTAAEGAEFFSPRIDPAAGAATVGVILSYNNPYTARELAASPTTAQDVAVLDFDISATAPPGDYPITLADGIGSPPVSNVFTSKGRTIRPSLGPGTLTVINLNQVMIESKPVLPGSSFTVSASGKHPTTIQGYSIAFTFSKVLTFVDVTYVGTDVQRAVLPQTIEFFLPKLDTGFSDTLNRVSVGAVVDYLPPFTGHEIPPSTDRWQSMARFSFSAPSDPTLLGTCLDLNLHNGGNDDVNNTFIIDKESFPPSFVQGKVCFGTATTFRRGFVNEDSRVDISDAINMLGYMFLGDPAPPCLNAADVNDDERFDISDVISSLSYQFGGGPAPLPPFDSCGVDPTSGDLGCDLAKQCQ
jgi:hypothetical protein